MIKKPLLFSLTLALLASSAHAGKFMEFYEEFRQLQTKAADPSVPEEEIAADFNKLQAKNSDRLRFTHHKFIEEGNVVIAFLANYFPLIVNEENGGSMPEKDKSHLFGTQDFLKEKQAHFQKKKKFFEKMHTEVLNTLPASREEREHKLSQINDLLNTSGLDPQNTYDYDAETKEARYSDTYLLKNKDGYSTAYRMMPPQQHLKSLILIETPAATDLARAKRLEQGENAFFGGFFAMRCTCDEQLKEGSITSLPTLLKERSLKWTERFEQRHSPVNPIYPLPSFLSVDEPLFNDLAEFEEQVKITETMDTPDVLPPTAPAPAEETSTGTATQTLDATIPVSTE